MTTPHSLTNHSFQFQSNSTQLGFSFVDQSPGTSSDLHFESSCSSSNTDVVDGLFEAAEEVIAADKTCSKKDFESISTHQVVETLGKNHKDFYNI